LANPFTAWLRSVRAAENGALMATYETPQAGQTVEDARIVRTRADVARTAFAILVEEGSEALTHARVAERAGYSKTTLYKHWPTRADLAATALSPLRNAEHREPTGDVRADLIRQLTAFRQAVLDLRLDLVLSAMTQWATVDTMRQLRDEINAEGQRPIRRILEQIFQGAELDASISMLSGVIACPALMFGTVPATDVIEAAVDVVLQSTVDPRHHPALDSDGRHRPDSGPTTPRR
jgi:AcrR family transcriptional regulator